MPDGSGQIKGISVPNVPWHTFCEDCGVRVKNGQRRCHRCAHKTSAAGGR